MHESAFLPFSFQEMGPENEFRLKKITEFENQNS